MKHVPKLVHVVMIHWNVYFTQIALIHGACGGGGGV